MAGTELERAEKRYAQAPALGCIIPNCPYPSSGVAQYRER